MSVIAALAISIRGGVFSKSDLSANEPFIVVHPVGYTGASGELTVKICSAQQSEILTASLRYAIRLWNALEPTTENCDGNCILWEEPPPAASYVSMRSVVLHELGHCAMGLGHINLANTSFTNSRDSTSINQGPDGVRGSSDDVPNPLPGTRILHWFRIADNDPFKIDATVISNTTFNRRIIDLPPGHRWPASGNRAVGALLGLNPTQSVMYNSIVDGQRYEGLTADDVNTVKYGMTGLDGQAGTADDYTIKLVPENDCANADIQVEFIPLRGSAPAFCLSKVIAIQNNHFRLANDPLIFSRLLLRVDSSAAWSEVFLDGFETGSLSAWSGAVP